MAERLHEPHLIEPRKSPWRTSLKSASLLLLISTLSIAGSLPQSSLSTTSQVQTHLARAQAALRAHDTAAAVKEFKEVLALDPKNVDASVNLGVVAFFQGHFAQAAPYLGHALAIDPSLVKAEALLGICEAKLGNSRAQGLLERSFRDLHDRSLRTETGLMLASLDYRRGDLDGAVTVVQALVNLSPDNLNVLFMAQRIYTDLAYDTTNKLAVLAPGSARMQEVIAERLVNAGDLRGAIEHYRKALAIDPNLADVHFELGEAILQLAPSDSQSQAEAKQEFETAMRMEGDSAAIECQLAELALHQSKLAGALAHYRRAFAMDPASSDANLGAGKALLAMGKSARAIPYLQTAIRSDPLNGQAHYQLAIAYRNLHRTGLSQNQMRIFNEINQSMQGVRKLYREMARPEFPGLRNQERRP